MRFNYVFIALLLAAATCAFFVPMEKSGRVRGHADVLFAPVTVPMRQVAAGVSRRLGWGRETPLVAADARKSPVDANVEIDQLQGQVTNLAMQLQALQRINADRDLAGDARKYSLPFKVLGGADAWLHNSFSLAGSSSDGLEVGMPAVYRNSLVGKIASVGGGGAQVRVITDPGFCVSGSFVRYDGSKTVYIKTDPPLLEGKGNGLMGITNLAREQIEQVRVGDWVVLHDVEDWPLVIDGYFLGRVEEIRDQPKAPLIWKEIVVRPRIRLDALREVMVVMLKSGSAAPPAVAKAPTKTARPTAPARPAAKGQAGKKK